MVFITAIRMNEDGTACEHIAEVQWVNPRTKHVGESSVATMVKFIDDHGEGVAQVQDEDGAVNVGVVRPKSGPPYIRTYANKRWTDNLLALPRF